MLSRKLLLLASLFLLGFAVYQTNAQRFAFEAEDFDAKQGESWQVIEAPATVMADEDDTRAPELVADDGSKILEYTIDEASGGAFIGHPENPGSAANGDWVKYEFNVPVTGDWYIWSRAIAPTIGDNSWFIGIDIPDEDVVSEDNEDMNIWDLFESSETPDDDVGTPLNTRFTTDWVWFRLNSRTGNPFPGVEIEQYGPNPTPLPLTAGQHTFHLAWREHSFCDVIFATMDASDDPNANPSIVVAVEAKDKLTVTWGQIKSTLR